MAIASGLLGARAQYRASRFTTLELIQRGVAKRIRAAEADQPWSVLGHFSRCPIIFFASQPVRVGKPLSLVGETVAHGQHDRSADCCLVQLANEGGAIPARAISRLARTPG